MFTYQYATFIFFLWIILWTSAKPVTKKDNSVEEPGGSSEKEKGSQEDIMFGNQQNKPAGMVDDILSFPENTDEKKASDNSTKPKSEGSVQEKEEIPKHSNVNNDYDYELEDGPHKYRLPSIPLNNILDDYPLYEEDSSLFRNKRESRRLRNELEDLLSGRQRRGLRLKRELDIPSLLKNLPPEEVLRFLPDLISEESDADENQEFHPNSYYIMDDPLDDAYWMENMPDRLEMLSQGNKFRQPYLALPKRDSPFLYTPGNVIVVPSEQETWNGRIGGGPQQRGIRRRRPLTIDDDNEDDDHLYDFLGLPERDFPDDL